MLRSLPVLSGVTSGSHLRVEEWGGQTFRLGGLQQTSAPPQCSVWLPPANNGGRGAPPCKSDRLQQQENCHANHQRLPDNKRLRDALMRLGPPLVWADKEEDRAPSSHQVKIDAKVFLSQTFGSKCALQARISVNQGRNILFFSLQISFSSYKSNEFGLTTPDEMT